MKELFDRVSYDVSRLTTERYSTSFSLGIKFLNKEMRDPIYSIYGFVRFADEIVDSFQGYDRQALLGKFRTDTYEAINERISLNPILNSFQETVHKFSIDESLIETFLQSMEMDLHKTSYSSSGYLQYIVGSAEVVGLMCLKVYCKGNEILYSKLKYYAERLGAAYQKINFLRDLSSDYKQLGRVYFPGLNMKEFNDSVKRGILDEIEHDFIVGYEGILKLPKGSRFGVYLSYIYFYSLYRKIREIPSETILHQRVRLPDNYKLYLFFKSFVKNKLNMIEWQN